MHPISYIGELRRAIEGVPDDRPILFQVVATNGQAWNMCCEFVPSYRDHMAILQLTHRELERLPDESFTSSATESQT